MNQTLLACALSIGAVTSLSAQRPLEGRDFVPPEPTSEIWIDFKTLRDSGVWDGVTVSLAASLVPIMEQQLGFRLTAIDRLRGYPHSGPRQEGHSDTGLVILEGEDSLVAPVGRSGSSTERIDGIEAEIVATENWWAKADPDWWVAPRPGLLVYGARHLVEPALRRERPPGVTPPELLSLSAGRGVLAHAVVTLDEAARRGLLSAVEAEAIEAPEFLMLRLRIDADATGDEDPTVHVDGTLRWAVSVTEPARMRDHLQQRLAALDKHPRYAALRKIWRKIELSADARDLTMHMDLGRPREAGGLFALAAPLLWFTGMPGQAELEVVEAAEVVEGVEAAPPTPAVPPKEPDTGGQRDG